MEDLDYFTVMEAKIKYYSAKYDPYNKLKRYKQLPPPEPLQLPIKVAKPKMFQRRMAAAFDSMVAFLF
jgi:hypothetical protein